MPQFKKFTAETVEVSEMNDFLASQVVGTFDSESARNTYFGSGGAFSVTEGMVTYLKDTGEFQVYKSSGWTTIGATGSTGATGATGASGATGATGATGSAGAAASITLGAVTTGEPGSNVSVTNTGTSSAAVFNFAIPRGLQGQQGLAGDKGDTGPVGPAGTGNVSTYTNNVFTTEQVIAASSATDLLRITQTGAGNALVVEDSANPDSTPFVVSASGLVGIGTTSPSAQLDVRSTTTQVNVKRFSDNASPSFLAIVKSRGTESSPVTANNGDSILALQGYGYDGTAERSAAEVRFAVDAVPASSTVAGRITFSTTPSAGTLTERMRIDSSGQVGIGATPVAGRTLLIGKAITGSTTSIGILNNGTIQSDVTTDAIYYRASASTQAASFTASAVTMFDAVGITTPGAGSTVTTQTGFRVSSGLTGASTNNFAFYGGISAATGRWNLYMDGTASNYMAGRLGVGATLTSGAMAQVTNTTAADTALVVKGAASQTGNLFSLLNSAGTSLFRLNSTGGLFLESAASGSALITVNGSVTGATTAWGVLMQPTFAADVTVAAEGYRTSLSTAASATLTTLRSFRAGNMTLGSGATVTDQVGFAVSSLTGATNNYGFYGDVAAATGRWNFFANGTAPNYMAGRLGVGVQLTTGAMAQVTNTTAADIALIVKGAASQSGLLLDVENSAGTTLMSVSSTGLVAGSGPSLGAWTAYTPTWGGNTTNPAIGNGTITGSYCQIGKTVFGRVKIVVGSTTTFGSGAYFLSLPVTAASTDQSAGQGILADNSASTRYTVVLTPSSTTNVWIRYGANALDTTSAAPMTWATNDNLVVSFTYEAA